MNTEDQERIEQNVQRTASVHALRKLRVIVDEDLREEAARARLLHSFFSYGWIVLLLAAGLLAHYLGVI